MIRQSIVLAALLAFSTAAQSASLVVGSNGVSGTTVAIEPQLAGTVVEDELTPVSFTISGGTFTATVQNRVVLSDDGTYDFYWRITDTSYDGTALAALGALRIGNFGSVIGDNGNFRLDGLGDLGPDSILVFNNPDGFFNFIFGDGLQGGLGAGSESYFMFIDTDAHAYAKTANFDLAGTGITGISSQFSTFAPAAVPEPATWAMMLLGFGGIGFAMRRSQRKALVTA
jgi:hypothetical protein